MDDQELAKANRAKLALDQISASACTVKWKHATLNLSAGQVKSCCHLPFRPLEQAGPAQGWQFHDSKEDRDERAQMLSGARPENCKYCWWIEDNGHLSDRTVWSSKSWMAPFTADVAEARSPGALLPSWVELNFSNVCTLKCSYCSPIFSTSWLREMNEHGAYPTLPPHNDLRGLPGVTKLGQEENQSLLNQFWPWFEGAFSGLRLLKLTGGEPLLSPQTLKVFDWVISHPNRDLSFSVNSNLMVSKTIWDEFVAKATRVRAEKATANFYLHPSIDSFGARAEYIRFGLNFTTFQEHVEDYLEKTGGNLVFICTLNNLSLGGVEQLWNYLLSLKKRFGPRDQEVSMTTELLQYPDWQNLNILPPEMRIYLDRAIAFGESNRGHGKVDFSDFEIQGLRRARDLMQSRPSNLETSRANFFRFFSEHDRRRKTCFDETFPELADFGRSCADLISKESNSGSR